MPKLAADVAKAISHRLTASPWQQGQDVSVRDVLDAASEQLNEEFADQPSIRARLHLTIGDAYKDLAVWDQAELHLKTAVEEYRQLYGDEHPDSGQAFNALGALYWLWGRAEDAQQWLNKGQEVLTRTLGPDDERTIKIVVMNAVMKGMFGSPEEAVRLLREVLQKELDPDEETRLGAMNALAMVLDRQGQYEEAREVIEEAVEIRRRVFGNDHPDTVGAINILATTLQHDGKLEQATPLFEETVAIWRRNLAPEHQNMIMGNNNLAFVYLEQGRYEDAMPLYKEVLEAIDRSLDPSWYGRGLALLNYARCLLHFERMEEAEAAFKEAHENLEAAFGPDHSAVHGTVRLIVEMYEAWNKPPLADEWRQKLPPAADE